MKRATINKWLKRVTTGILAASLALAGSMIYSTTTEAANESVTYDPANDAFEEWQTRGTAPVKAGYLFGGWYTSEDGGEVLTEETVKGYTGNVYAKFVPSYVLSVKAQIDANTQKNGAEDQAEASIRILTGVDSLQYQYIGAEILLGNRLDTKAETKTTVYKTLLMSDDTNTEKINANELFGTAANYFSVWKIINIEDINDDSIIYVRPYWETMDGTIVYGLAKYVHVEDGYLRYVSVPINMMSGQQAAAGVATISCENSDLFTGDVIVEEGRVFDDAMESSTFGDTVKIVGNGATVGSSSKDAKLNVNETLFANVRFKLQDGIELYNVDETTNVKTRANGFLKFTILDSDFSDWNENPVDAGAWDIQY